jgi:hypothetical protein
MKQYEVLDESSDDEGSDDEGSDELQYRYYDAMGRPYLDSVIQRPNILNEIIKEREEEERVRNEQDIPCFDEVVFTSLKNPDESCPARFISDTSTWAESLASYRLKIAQDKADAEISEFTLFDEQRAAECKKMELDLIVSRLPKFPTLTLKRMADEAAEVARIAAISSASSKYYTAKKTQSNKAGGAVWGHRRNGGGKGKKVERMVALPGQLSEQAMSRIRDEKYKKLVVISDLEAKSSRQLKRGNKKEKDVFDRQKRLDKEEEIRTRMSVMSLGEPEVVPEVVEETDWQKFKRHELQTVISKQKCLLSVASVEGVKHTFDELVMSTKDKSVAVEPKVRDGWNTVVTKSITKRKSTENTLVRMFYDDPSKSVNKGRPVGGAPVPFSRLCMSVIESVKCRHGKRCKFAHSPSQLNISPCGFGDRCKNAKCVAGKWVNTPGRKCMFSHPGEEVDKVAFCLRLGMKKELTVPVKRLVVNTPKCEVECVDGVFNVTSSNLDSVIREIVASKITDVVLRFV